MTLPGGRAPLARRFWARVNKDGPEAYPGLGPCWLWTGNVIPSGYGSIIPSGTKRVSAHRVAWELTNGPIPPGIYACHKCDVKLCVRPDHLFLGTQKDNMQDAKVKGIVHSGERHWTKIDPDKWAAVIRRRRTGTPAQLAQLQAARDARQWRRQFLAGAT